MAQGRGSARSALVVAVAILCLFAVIEPIFAATFTVGDRGGWTFNVNNWPRGKRFRAGDTLVFNYAKSAHNVVPVNRNQYSSCNARGARALQSGRDSIRLKKGANYFICSFPGHCQGGMKIAVIAA